MSKSLGNFFTMREVLAKFDAEVLRLFLLGTHYRNPINFSDVILDEAERRLALPLRDAGEGGPARARHVARRRGRCAGRGRAPRARRRLQHSPGARDPRRGASPPPTRSPTGRGRRSPRTGRRWPPSRATSADGGDDARPPAAPAGHRARGAALPGGGAARHRRRGGGGADRGAGGGAEGQGLRARRRHPRRAARAAGSRSWTGRTGRPGRWPSELPARAGYSSGGCGPGMMPAMSGSSPGASRAGRRDRPSPACAARGSRPSRAACRGALRFLLSLRCPGLKAIDSLLVDRVRKDEGPAERPGLRRHCEGDRARPPDVGGLEALRTLLHLELDPLPLLQAAEAVATGSRCGGRTRLRHRRPG